MKPAMFTVLQEFVEAVVGNSMLLMFVIAVPVATGAVVFYMLAREPARPGPGGWIGRLTRRGRRPTRRARPGQRGRVRVGPPSPDPIEETGEVGPLTSVPVRQVIFIDPFQDEEADDVYDLDDFDADLEAEDGLDTLSN